VLYDGDVCLGGGVIATVESGDTAARSEADAATAAHAAPESTNGAAADSGRASVPAARL
jgi:hypothetical protein